MKYKNIDSKILNTKFIKEKSNFKNPTDPTTFGNRFLKDKFSRSINMEGIV